MISLAVQWRVNIVISDCYFSHFLLHLCDGFLGEILDVLYVVKGPFIIGLLANHRNDAALESFLVTT